MKFNRSRTPERSTARRRSSASKTVERPTGSELTNKYAFRRNRTLTGSSSPAVASSNELNAELRSPRAHVHHLTSLRRRIIGGLIGTTVVAGVLYFLVSQLAATISLQVNEGGLITPEDDVAYQKSFETYYASRPAERLRFLLNEPALLSHLRSTRPEVSSVQIAPGATIGEASVEITTRRPIARWDLNGNNLYVDGDGVVYGRNYYETPALQIVDNSGLTTRSDRLLASDRFLGFIGRIVASADTFELSVDKVTIPELTTRQVAITLKGQKTSYMLSVDQPVGEQVENMARVHRYLDERNITPTYADVRVGGKAYYR